MQKVMKRAFLFVLSAFILTPVYSANDKAFLWEVSSQQNTVYLMGSIHFADSSFYPLRKKIEDAYNRSHYLVVELNVNDINPEDYRRILLERGRYENDKTIKDVLSKKTWQQLQQRLVEFNIDYEAVKKLKPGILVLTLTAMQIAQMGFDPSLGVDVHFLNQAAEQDNKTIISLETLRQQLDLFINIPDGELLLKESLYSMDESQQLLFEMLDYWKQGNEVRMNSLLFEKALIDYPEFSKVYESLFYTRNRQMTSKIEAMLKQKETYFVVVGSGHLIGDKGIVQALKNKGFELKRM